MTLLDVAIVPYRRVADLMSGADNAEKRRRVGNLIDRNFDSLTARETIIISLGDETTAIGTGTAVMTFRMPYDFMCDGARASLTTASSSGDPAFEVNHDGTPLFAAPVLTIESGETTSTSAPTPVIANPSIPADSEVTVDITAAGTGAAGAKVYLLGRRT